jgi:toxin ParE1/3/4
VTDLTRPWKVRLTAAAEADFADIVRWTREHFGEAQALVYGETLSMALEALHQGISAVGVRPREEIAQGLFSLKVARNGRKGRHFVLFRIARPETRNVIEVLRLLHDSMDLPHQFADTVNDR